MEQEKKKGRLLTLILTTVGAVLIVLVIVGISFYVKTSREGLRLKNAEDALTTGNLELLTSLINSEQNDNLRSTMLNRAIAEAERFAAAADEEETLAFCQALEGCGVETSRTDELRRTLADRLKDKDEYDKAKALYTQIGDAAAEEAVKQCDYGLASAAIDQGEHLRAREILETLGDYPGSEQLREQCTEGIYDDATRLMYGCKFQEARELYLSLNGYSDSDDKADFCQYRMELAASGGREAPIWTYSAYASFPNGCLYSTGQGLLYVPYEINEDTRCFSYFAGGIGENYLYATGVFYYLNTYNPNAVMYFSYTSGFFTMEYFEEYSAELLIEASEYLGFVVHDVVTAGSSHGCYTAMKVAARYYLDYGWPVRAAVSLDAGEDFNLQEGEEELFLNDEEYQALGEAGTEMLLFEERWGVSKENRFVKKMFDAGAKVYIIECTDGDHNMISVNAYTYGLFSWALGDLESINEYEYTIIEVE